MAVEKKRGCGYRQVGGLYIVGKGMTEPCDRMPYELRPCPVCNCGPKFSRGWQWISDPLRYFGFHGAEKNEAVPWTCACETSCPLCYPLADDPYGLMPVSSAAYTPEEFVAEAAEMGVSKRIAAVPNGLIPGRTWVLLSHKKFPYSPEGELFEGVLEPDRRPAIFYAFRPTRVEMIVTQTQLQDVDFMESLRKRSLVPVAVPDDDTDHNNPMKEHLPPRDESAGTRSGDSAAGSR